jgi:hypothetical protein
MKSLSWFWFLLSWACVAWYATITVYVAFRGYFDIKGMLRRIGTHRDDDGDL